MAQLSKDQLFMEAVYQRNMDSLSKQIADNTVNEKQLEMGLLFSCVEGQLEIVKLLHSHLPSSYSLDQLTWLNSLQRLSAHGYMDVLQFIYSLYPRFRKVKLYINRSTSLLYGGSHVYLGHLFRHACASNNLPFVQWMWAELQTLMSQEPDESIRQHDRGELLLQGFTRSSEMNCLKILVWLKEETMQHSINAMALQLFSYPEEPIYAAITKGHMTVLEFFAMSHADVIFESQHAFRLACEFGQSHVVQWMVNESHARINDTKSIHFAFRQACFFNSVSLAKFLLCHYPQINVTDNNDAAFRVALSNRRSNVLLFLNSLLPHRYILTFDDYGQINDGHIDTSNLLVPSSLLPITSSIHKEDKDKVACGICLDNMEDIQSSCGHSFCKKCMIQYYVQRKQTSCPYCRQTITTFYKIV